MPGWLVAALVAPALVLSSIAAPVSTVSTVSAAAPVTRATAAAVAVPAARSATPPPRSPGRVSFNDPFGSRAQQLALITRIDRVIDRAPKGATIRLAAYSFAMPQTTDALIRAHRRGVHVRVVVDERSRQWSAYHRLRHNLGTNRHGRSFVRACRGSCRGGSGNQHAKFVTVSSAGRARDLVMVGSMNFTEYAASWQWQDLYRVSDRRLFLQLRQLFGQMAADRRPVRRLRVGSAGDGLKLQVAPIRRYVGRRDPLVRRLAAVRCTGATGGTGLRGRTVVRISMHAWNGERGVRLARKVVRLRRAGCNVKVLAGVGFGRRVLHLLELGRVRVRDSDRRGRATHEKLMVVSGRFGRRTDASFAWTGSHNWSDRSLRNDEVTLRVAGPRLVRRYLDNFRAIWRSSR